MKITSLKKKSPSIGLKSRSPFFIKSNRKDSYSQNVHTSQNQHFFNPFGVDSYSGMIQAKLTVGKPGDKYEKEADAMANQVMRMNDPLIQRQSIESEEDEIAMPKSEPRTIQMKCDECEKEEESLLRKPLAGNISPVVQREETSGGQINNRVETSLKASKNEGKSLHDDTRHWMESRFGSDFSRVKVHTDSHAVQMSRELNAQAFTYGSDIYFNQGKFNPSSSEGKHLLAHELTHVVQQTGYSVLDRSQEGGDKTLHRFVQCSTGDGHDLQSQPIMLDPVLEAVYDNERLVRSGQSGEAIRKIQESLVSLGFPLPKFGVDGIFGTETELSVRKYQASKGLSTDGVIGPLTISMMDVDLGGPGENQSKISEIDIPNEIEAGETIVATARTKTGEEVSAPVAWRLLQGPPGSKVEQTSDPVTAVTSPNSGFLTLSASKSPQKIKTVKVTQTGVKVCKYTFKELDESKASGGKVAVIKGKVQTILWYDFLPGKSDIRSNHTAAVKKLIQIDKLNQNIPQSRIRFIFGFSDCVGQESKNLTVRTARAIALRDEFISSGALSKHIGTPAPSRPGAELGNNFTSEGRARNRSALIVSEFVEQPKPKKKKKLDDVIDRLKKVAKTISIKRQRERLLCLLDMVMDKSKDDHYINGFDHIVRILAKGQFPKLSPDDFAKFVLNNSARKDLTNPSFTPDDDKLVRENLKLLDERILSGINLVFDQLTRNEQLNFKNPVLEQMHKFISIQQRNPNSIYFCYGKGQK